MDQMSPYFQYENRFHKKRKIHHRGAHDIPPSNITYCNVVSFESMRIAFILLAALNDVELLTTGIGNACLNALPCEKVYTMAGPEFGAVLQGQPVLIVRALYGLKSSCTAWRAHLASTLISLRLNHV